MIARILKLYARYDSKYAYLAHLIRFIISGGTGAFVDLSFLYILTDVVHVWYVASTIVAFMIAFVAGFSLQKYWAFRDHSSDRLRAQASGYFAVAVVNLIVNTCLVYLFVQEFHVYYIASQMIASVLIAFESYFAYRYIFSKGYTMPYLARIKRYSGLEKARLLVIGHDEGDFPASAEAEGWSVTRVKDFGHLDLPADRFDVCVLSGVISPGRDPSELLRAVRGALVFRGVLCAIAPGSDREALELSLAKAGFREIVIEHGGKSLGGRRLDAFCRKIEPRPVLSVVVPAFNEARTFSTLMEGLLKKGIPGLALEIIIVESNSIDGTRELALGLGGNPRIKLILQDSPRGKGFAVREGLAAATGDYVLIQDADLEYDLDDYDALVAPLVAGRASFVLGSRHTGRSALYMRQFTRQRGLSAFVNAGHVFFTFLVNVLFTNRLRDPFTMYKVFRRDCLYGLEFRCDRFDFDFELLAKLLRKGYRPVELPVRYHSRSFAEGKKVRMFRDPISWLKALAWLRFARIDPMAVSVRSRRKAV